MKPALKGARTLQSYFNVNNLLKILIYCKHNTHRRSSLIAAANAQGMITWWRQRIKHRLRCRWSTFISFNLPYYILCLIIIVGSALINLKAINYHFLLIVWIFFICVSLNCILSRSNIYISSDGFIMQRNK